MLIIVLVSALFHFYSSFHFIFRKKTYFARKIAKPITGIKNYPKPAWVINEVIKLKALQPTAGCRTLAHTFNRRHAEKRQMAVSKTFVSYTVKKHEYDIQILRRKLKHRRPRDILVNKIWAMDLTFISDNANKQSTIIGIIERQSRLSLSLTQLQTKSTINILRTLFIAMECFGKPGSIRTDNEAVFTSRLFSLALKLLGIKHQKTDKGCPWQNGRIERFFGTFKSKLNLLPIGKTFSIDKLLREYRCWYNYLRPHDYLNGQTPIEVITGKKKSTKKPRFIQLWDGVLVGDYYPP